MASGDDRADTPEELNGEGLTVGIVRARWNPEIVERLADGARRGLESLGVTDIVEVSVPGSYEIPYGAKVLATSGQVDAVIGVGVVLRGETTHYEIVSQECARGLQDVQLITGIACAFGVLTVEDRDQALARSQGEGGHNVGEEAALVAVEMTRLRQRFEPEFDDDTPIAGHYL